MHTCLPPPAPRKRTSGAVGLRCMPCYSTPTLSGTLVRGFACERSARPDTPQLASATALALRSAAPPLCCRRPEDDVLVPNQKLHAMLTRALRADYVFPPDRPLRCGPGCVRAEGVGSLRGADALRCRGCQRAAVQAFCLAPWQRGQAMQAGKQARPGAHWPGRGVSHLQHGPLVHVLPLPAWLQ